MSKVQVMDHPLIQHKIALIRDKDTGSKDFRELVEEIAMLMGYEVTRDLPLKEVEIETPIATAKAKIVAGKDVAIVPILRAGLGMVNGMLNLMPTAKVGHIGLYRDPETLLPVEYYCKLPVDIDQREVILVDPMLATGGSAVDAINSLKAKNAKHIKFVCLIAAPEGVKAAFRKMKEIGYQTVQLSAICEMDAAELKSISEQTGLPIVTTHTPPARILNDTDAVIAEHKLFGCPEVGIGAMPAEYQGSIEGVRKFIADYTPAMKKIRAAGLRFAYHNHAFEFEDLGGTNAYEVLIKEMPELFFIVDTYWLRYAGQDVLKTIERLKDRIVSVHFKDMAGEPKGKICPCGDGCIDFLPIMQLCDALHIPEALVEQDNAPETDSYECMAKSFKALRGMFGI